MKRIRRTPQGNRCDKSLDSQGILLFVLKRGKIAIFRQPLFFDAFLEIFHNLCLINISDFQIWYRKFISLCINPFTLC